MKWPSLSGDNVHVWLAKPENSEAGERFIDALSDDERSRAATYRLERDRDDFIRRRGILRILLGRYLDADPPDLKFDYGQNGKPLLGAAHAASGLCFNLSHSDGSALFAFSFRRVGVDIERLRPIPDPSAIVESFFSAREKALFRALPVWRKDETLLSLWTQKEAYLKAIGEGLSRPLDDLESLPAPWTIRTLLQDSGFAAALAVEGKDFQASLFQWAL